MIKPLGVTQQFWRSRKSLTFPASQLQSRSSSFSGLFKERMSILETKLPSHRLTQSPKFVEKAVFSVVNCCFVNHERSHTRPDFLPALVITKYKIISRELGKLGSFEKTKAPSRARMDASDASLHQEYQKDYG